MKYLDLLKSKKQAGTLTDKTDKRQNTSKQLTDKTDKRPSDSFVSTLTKHFSDNKENCDCPARCKHTGKCYGYAYFDGKGGKPSECSEHRCTYQDKLRAYWERYFSFG